MNATQPKLFIHSLRSDQLGDGLAGDLGSDILRTLSVRALLLSKMRDMVIVDTEPDQDWLRFLKYCGIEVGEFVVANGTGQTIIDRVLNDPRLLKQLSNQNWTIDPYMGGESVQLLADSIGAKLDAPGPTLLDQINLKSNLNHALIDAGIPTIPTTTMPADQTLAAARTMLNEIGPVIVRSDLSIGGHGVWKVQSDSDFEALEQGIKRSDSSRLFIIQPLLNVVNSPNIQFHIHDSGPQLLGISSQHMTQSFAFGGNEYPSPLEKDTQLLGQCSQVAQWLHARGYRGIVGIDCILTTDDQVYIVEINPRVNTSTFPLLLCKRLGRTAFRLITGIPVDGIDSFNQLKHTIGIGLLYDPQWGSGVIPLMVPSTQRPVLDAMVFADDPEDIARLCDLLSGRVQIGALQ